MSSLEKVISGGKVESYRYHYSLQNDPSRVTRKIESIKEKLKRRKPLAYFKELIPSLVGCGYLKQDTMKPKHQYAVSENSIIFSMPFHVLILKKHALFLQSLETIFSV